jgi:hypothetical protein
MKKNKLAFKLIDMGLKAETLANLTDDEIKLNPWRLKAIERPFSDCIPYVQDRQNEWSEEKYQQVIDSIKMKGEEVDNYII